MTDFLKTLLNDYPTNKQINDTIFVKKAMNLLDYATKKI